MTLKDKSDIEIMALMHELETKLAQVQQALQAVQQEAMRRIQEHKEKSNEPIQ